jgi:diguanylate cyclase (GGDEF)-like protein
MQAAQTRGRRPKLPASGGDDAGIAKLYDGPLQATLARGRSLYLEALPIAAAIVELAKDGAFVEGANGLFRYLAEWDDRIGDRSIDQVRLLTHGQIGERFRQFIASGESAHQFESSDGRPIGARHFLVRFARVRTLDAVATRILVSLIDRTSQVETERSLRSGMLLDSLTGLPNRLAFNEKVDALLSAPNLHDGEYAVLAVDMTRFSRVNECMGATAGDELLITFARRLVSALRPTDMLARTSGDEFAILMKLDRGISDALRASERIKAVLTLPFRLTDLEIRVDCAIGCAMLSPSVSSADEILRNAQFALKRAKHVGVTQVFEAVQAQAVRARFSMETELRRAIEAEELALAFQPLIDLRSGEVAGFEALARWKNNLDASIPPSEFIPVAEESGLIVPLGRWALEAATRTLAEWDHKVGRELPFSVSVNLSAIQISRDDVASVVRNALADSGLDPRRLTLELTESAIIHDPDRASKALNALKKLKVRVAMDDFGTGYTSLASLQRLPIDILKIDRSLVANLLEDEDAASIVRAILSLASALGMETTAEGIEREELGAVLAGMGCTYAQGFHYARPMEADAAIAYWIERNA